MQCLIRDDIVMTVVGNPAVIISHSMGPDDTILMMMMINH